MDRPNGEVMLVDDAPNSEAIVAEHDENTRQTELLRAALEELTERGRRVFKAPRRSDDPPSLIGRELSLSSERVRHIKSAAFAKVKPTATTHSVVEL